MTDGDGTTVWDDAYRTPAINLAVFAATLHNMGRVVMLTDIDFPGIFDPETDGFPTLYDGDNFTGLGSMSQLFSPAPEDRQLVKLMDKISS